MNVSNSTQGASIVPENSTTVYSIQQEPGMKTTISTRVYDTAGWTFNIEDKHLPVNLTFLAALAIFVFIIYVLLKIYKWYSDHVKMKARGDMEYDDCGANYGIVEPGDKHFCSVDIRSDTTSVYDTVNSFRLFGNGHPGAPLDPYQYQDTVTSIKSLVMQKADGGHYDSVKSYKAFLQKITQNKDLAVEVKLLENYPMRSKSSEHFVVVEEESSERSENVTTKLLNFLPLKSKAHEAKCSQAGKKKQKARRASGDLPPTMRKRSASNPVSRRPLRQATSSLPSIHCPGSSDSEEETQQSFRLDRKRLWAERKKMSQSGSAGKLMKEAKSLLAEKDVPEQSVKRRRHFSADSAKKPQKILHGLYKGSKQNNKPKGTSHVLFTLALPEERRSFEDLKGGDESSSENPTSSHSSCDEAGFNSDVVSDSDDDTKDNTLMSMASDRTLDNDVFAPSDVEVALSSEILDLDSKPLPITEQNTQEPDSSKTLGSVDHSNSAEGLSVMTNSPQLQTTASLPSCLKGANQESGVERQNSDLWEPEEKGPTDSESLSACSSPKKVQRFHVTFVNDGGTCTDSSCMHSD